MDGWSALAVAIIKQAYKDRAWSFFETEWCDVLLACLGIDKKGRDILENLRGGGEDG